MQVKACSLGRPRFVASCSTLGFNLTWPQRILSVSGVADAIHIATYYVGNILIEASERQPNSNSTSTYRPSGTSSRGPRYAPAPAFSGYYNYPPQPAPAPFPAGPPQTQQIYIPNDLVGCIIGKGGSKINEIRSLSASQIRIMEPGVQGPPGTAQGNPNERLVIITGQPQNIQMAVNLLYHVSYYSVLLICTAFSLQVPVSAP